MKNLRPLRPSSRYVNGSPRPSSASAPTPGGETTSTRQSRTVPTATRSSSRSTAPTTVEICSLAAPVRRSTTVTRARGRRGRGVHDHGRSRRRRLARCRVRDPVRRPDRVLTRRVDSAVVSGDVIPICAAYAAQDEGSVRQAKDESNGDSSPRGGSGSPRGDISHWRRLRFSRRRTSPTRGRGTSTTCTDRPRTTVAPTNSPRDGRETTASNRACRASSEHARSHRGRSEERRTRSNSASNRRWNSICWRPSPGSMRPTSIR